jgi:hypothetical protein
VWRYTVRDFVHKCQMYLKATPSGDDSGYNAVPRGAFVPPGVSDLMDPLFTVMAPFYKSDTASFNGMTLEHLVSGGWVPIYSATTAVTPTGSAANDQAFGYCVAGKTTDNKHLKAYIFEGHFGTVSKISGYGGAGAGDQAVIDYFFNVGGGAANTDAYAWRTNRGETYADRFLAVVIDSNEKLRRIRRIK